ncbi:MAG: hypothetical protein N2203_03595 [Bacteroidia bacterium]|nr:hypothetical protein [Bacteroidia bacterium]
MEYKIGIKQNSYSTVPVIISLRAVAALSVLLYHILITISGILDNSFFRYVFDYGQKGVQVFFTISSVVIPLMLIKTNYQIHHFFEYLKKNGSFVFILHFLYPLLFCFFIGILELFFFHLITYHPLRI